MPIDVRAQPNTLAGTGFVFIVPAGELWSLRSVVANVARAAGGTPGRSYILEISDGTNVVGAFTAQDAGTDPGTCEITWCGAPAGVGATGAAGIVSAPMRADRVPTGYTITGLIVGSVAGDAFVDALCWIDYVEV